MPRLSSMRVLAQLKHIRRAHTHERSIYRIYEDLPPEFMRLGAAQKKGDRRVYKYAYISFSPKGFRKSSESVESYYDAAKHSYELCHARHAPWNSLRTNGKWFARIGRLFCSDLLLFYK